MLELGSLDVTTHIIISLPYPVNIFCLLHSLPQGILEKQSTFIEPKLFGAVAEDGRVGIILAERGVFFASWCFPVFADIFERHNVGGVVVFFILGGGAGREAVFSMFSH